MAIIIKLIVIAPPILVATWAKGIISSRSAVDKIAIFPEPPIDAWFKEIMPDSTGYIFVNRDMKNPFNAKVKTTDNKTAKYRQVKIARTSSRDINTIPIATITGVFRLVESVLKKLHRSMLDVLRQDLEVFQNRCNKYHNNSRR